jgi:hypothetical protein
MDSTAEALEIGKCASPDGGTSKFGTDVELDEHCKDEEDELEEELEEEEGDPCLICFTSKTAEFAACACICCNLIAWVRTVIFCAVASN